MRIANDDPELFDWLRNVMKHGGSFLRSIGDAGFRADAANYKILRPALLELKTKYPKYVKEGEDLGERPAQRAVEFWNRMNPIGTKVDYYERLEEPVTLQAFSKSEAFVADSGVACIFLERKSGYVMLSHCVAVKEAVL